MKQAIQLFILHFGREPTVQDLKLFGTGFKLGMDLERNGSDDTSDAQDTLEAYEGRRN